MATYPRLYAGQRFTADLARAMLPDVITKMADESYASVLQNDDELLAAVLAGDFLVDGEIFYKTTDAADLKIAWAVPAGAEFRWKAPSIGPSVTSANGDIYVGARSAADEVIVGGGGGADLTITIKGRLSVTTPGTLQLRWGVNTIDGNSATVYAGSWLKLRQIL